MKMRSLFWQAVRTMGWPLLAGVLVVLGPGIERAARAAQGGVVTDDEVRKFAAVLEKGVVAGDASVFASEIDWDAIIEKAITGVEAPATFRDGFRKGVKSSLEKSNSMAGKIIEQAKLGGSYKL